MSKLNRKSIFVLSFLAMALPSLAQIPNCQINFGPWTTINTSTILDNRTLQCPYFVMSYQVTGFSAISLRFESATGATTPGAFGAYSGTVTTGVNPSVSVACSTPGNCTAVFTGIVGWARVALNSATGSGTVVGTLQGWKTGVPLGGNSPPSGSGCPGTAGTPCVVDGVTAAGSPPATPPVLISGQDGTNVQTIKTDTAGRPQVVGAAAAGAAVAGNPLLQGWSDGTNAQNVFFCPLQAAVTISAGTDTVIVAGVSAKKTIICHFDFAADSAQTFTIQQGTGSTCGTGTAAITGAYPTISSFAADYQPTAALRTTVNANDVCLHSAGSVTVGGFVVYAQF